MTNNSTLQSTDYGDDVIGYPQDWQVVLAVNFIIIAIVSPVLNLLIVYIICRYKELRTPTNVFIASLAFGETLFCLFSLPFTAASLLESSWPYSRSMCQGSAFMQTLGRTFSRYCLILVCFDRYIAISRPLKYAHVITLTFSVASVFIVWCFSLLLSILLQLVWDSYSYTEILYGCGVEVSVSRSQGALVKEVISSYIPIFLTLMYLLAVVKEVKSHHRIFAIVQFPTNPSTTEPPVVRGNNVVDMLPVPRAIGGFNRNTRRALRSFFIMSLSFVICCFPLSVSGLVLRGETAMTSIQPTLLVSMWLSYLYCVVNPAIIILFNRKFQSQIKQMIFLLCCCSRTSNKQSQDIFTISSGLQGVLETTMIKSLGRGGKTSIAHSTRRARISVTT